MLPFVSRPSTVTIAPEAPTPCTAKYACCIAREPPTSGDDSVTPTTSWPSPWIVLPVGTASSTSRESTCVFWLLWTSTTGEEPETVTDSSSAPTFMSALTVAVKFDGNSSPSRLNVLNPCSEKVMV